MADPALSICIVSHNAYGAISGGASGFIGGVEWQTSLLARWLAAQGHRVSLITWQEGGPQEETIAGVRVIKVCGASDGFPVLRFFHPKWTGLLKALQQANADVYYQNCAEAATGQIALWCQRNCRAFVFSLASDADCDPKFPELGGRHNRFLYQLGLRRATRVISQTLFQQQRLRDLFSVDSQVIPMPCPGPTAEEFTPPDPATRRVLWVGRVFRVKRPDRFLDVAEACPELEFDFVGPAFDEAYSQDMMRRAGKIKNVTVHGPVPRARMAAFYQRAGCFCCTSEYEGFPNTFLESWSYGLPVVSTFDPDSRIKNQGLGIVALDSHGIADGIKRLFSLPDYYRQISINARRYYAANHTIEAVMPQFDKVFRSAAGNHSKTPKQFSMRPEQDSEPQVLRSNEKHSR